MIRGHDELARADAIMLVLSDEDMKKRLSRDPLATIYRVKENGFQSLLSELIFS
jgi:hypothetical protein